MKIITLQELCDREVLDCESEPPLTVGDLLAAVAYMVFIGLLVFGPELARTFR